MATREEERALVHELADAVGALMEFWGFKRVMGRLWTVLYLTGEPLSAAELCDRLAISTGAVSKSSPARGSVSCGRFHPVSRRESRAWPSASRTSPISLASDGACSPRWCRSTRSTWLRWCDSRAGG